MIVPVKNFILGVKFKRNQEKFKISAFCLKVFYSEVQIDSDHGSIS